jgi:hypothetical protein
MEIAICSYKIYVMSMKWITFLIPCAVSCDLGGLWICHSTLCFQILLLIPLRCLSCFYGKQSKEHKATQLSMCSYRGVDFYTHQVGIKFCRVDRLINSSVQCISDTRNRKCESTLILWATTVFWDKLCRGNASRWDL